MALKHVSVRNAKPRPKRYKLCHEKGLFVFVKPIGSRLWRLKVILEGRSHFSSSAHTALYP